MRDLNPLTGFGLAACLAALGCATPDRAAPVRQRVQAVELTDDDELPPPPGQEVAPVVPAGEVPGGVQEPGQAAEDEEATAAEPAEETAPAEPVRAARDGYDAGS